MVARLKMATTVPVVSDVFGVAGHLEWLPVASLTIPPEYQRIIRWNHVNKLAKEFDPDVFGMITVSERRDNARVILDGQHRIEALRAIGWFDQNVPCLVYRGLTLAQEAKVFLKFNSDRLPVKPAERFRAALVAENPQAVAINAMASAYGFTINVTTGSTKQPNCIDSVGAVEWISRQYGMDALSDVLSVLRDAYGKSGHKLSGGVIRGITIFMMRYKGHYDRNRLIHVLKGRTPADIESDARAIVQGLGGRNDEANGMAVWRRYNFRLATGQLATWDLAPNRKGGK